MQMLWRSLSFIFLSQTLTGSYLNFKVPVASLSRWEWVAASIIKRDVQTMYDVQIICENITCASSEFLKKLEVPVLLSEPQLHENSLLFMISKSLSFVTSVLDSATNATKSKYVVFVECVECAPVEWILEKCWQHNILNIVVILLQHEHLLTYTYFPFRKGTCFDRSPVLLGKFTNLLVSNTELFPQRKVWDLHHCTLIVSSFTFPGIYFEGGQMKGRFSSVFYAVAKSMNFVADFIHTDGKGWFGSASGPNKTGIRGDVYTGLAHLGFGFIQALEFEYLEFDGLALPGCLTWCVAATYKTKPLWWFLIGEFAYSVWIMLMVSAIVILAIDYVARKLMSRYWLHSDIPLAGMLWAAFLQVPQRIPRRASLSFRVLWISCIMPSLVLSTVYLSTLKSLRTAPYKEYKVKSLEDLADAGIQAWYITSLAAVVNDASTSNPSVAKLRSNSFVFPPRMTATMFSIFEYKNISVLMLDELCRVCREIYADRKDFTMYPLPKACMQVRAWHLFVMARNSVFSDAIKIRVGQLTQAGIVQIVIKENKTLLRSTDIKARQITVRNMFPALLLLSCGLGLSAVAFFLEMLLSFFLQNKNALKQGR